MTSLKRPLSNGLASSTTNISSKVFVRSGKGKCHKIVREIYLRQDIPCSSKLCSQCTFNAPTDASGKVQNFVLSERPPGTSAYPNGHYLIPDTNIFLYCMDVMEHESAFYDVIVLQTVLEELRNRSLPLYNRLRALTKSHEKRFYVFHNEFRQETYVKRLQGEIINDRNDRAVRRACTWYKSHLATALTSSSHKVPEIVMISDDRGNLEKARVEGITCCNVREYVQGLKNADELLDMISAAVEDQEAKVMKGEMLYPEYFSVSKMMTGVKAGTLHQGTFNVSPYNFLEGSVATATLDRALLVLGRENINRAVQGDQVVVEILPKDQWKQASAKIVDEETLTKNDNPDVDEPEAIETVQERKALIDEAKESQGLVLEAKPQPTARIVGIVKRNWR